MASTDITALIDYYVREKEITRERVMTALEAAFLSAYYKMIPGSEQIGEIKADINPQKGTVKIKAMMLVVADDDFHDPYNEIKLSTAEAISARTHKTTGVGEYMVVNITPPDFGRIAVQTARQTMQQRIRKAEQEMLADAFKDRIGELVTGTVRRYDKGDVIVDVERFEAVMPLRQRIPNEDYSSGDQLRFYVLEVRDGVRGCELLLSRSHPNLVRRLFENEVQEIAENTVEIVNIVRDAGYRSKLIVRSLDPNVDPIGACVGMRGMRVKNIVNELNREKIDIMEYSDDKGALAQEALAPIEPVEVKVDEENRVVTVIVEDDRAAAKAKGRKGLNVRLTARLISTPEEKWDVRVEPVSNNSRTEAIALEGAEALVAQLAVSPELASSMIACGFTTVQGIAAYVQAEDLIEALSISQEEADVIIEKAKAQA